MDGKSVNELIAEIDAARGVKSGLASAIRVFVLDRIRSER
jgi:predicted DNA-binding ribbon-helix-helix protein